MTIRTNPAVERLEPYIPGEQPRGGGYIKLNTNENPYPPAPAVIEAVRHTADEAAYNKYPDPVATSLREAVATSLHVPVQQVLAGNGSDEVLRLICHAFLDPNAGDSIGMLNPTYVLYQTLAEMFGAGVQSFRVQPPDYVIPGEAVSAAVKVFFLPNPNPPIGTRYPIGVLEQLAAADPARLLVVDEAYVDFASGDSMEVFRRFPNVAVTRTFSKSYSLAGMRVGFIVAREPLIAELAKIKDSYNLNRVSLAAAEAAWKSRDYYDARCREICADREWLRAELIERGFEVPASEGNFVFVRRAAAADLYARLKERKILVRYFKAAELADGVRITIGTRPELKALLAAIDDL